MNNCPLTGATGGHCWGQGRGSSGVQGPLLTLPTGGLVGARGPAGPGDNCDNDCLLDLFSWCNSQTIVQMIHNFHHVSHNHVCFPISYSSIAKDFGFWIRRYAQNISHLQEFLSFGKRTELKSEGNETSHRVPFYFKRKVEFVTVQKKKEEKVSFDPSFPKRRR